MAGAVAVDIQDHGSAPSMGGSRRYAIMVCIFASLAGLFFGYDQGVTGGVVVMKSFLRDFCEPYGYNMTVCKEAVSNNLAPKFIDFTLWYNMVYNIGCIFGALIGGFVADKFGRRATIFSAGFWFCLGTTGVITTPAGNDIWCLVFRVVEGVGVGNASFSAPIFGAEMAPKELRGFLSGFMQMTIVTGLLVSNIVNLIVEDTEQGWRTTNGVAMAAPVIVMAGIFFLPESPRWVYTHKGKDQAEVILKRLRQTEHVGEELNAIGEAIELEGQQAAWSELWRVASIRRRVLIAMFLQLLQQATGINPMFTYGGMIFESIVGKGVVSVFALSVVNFLSTIPAMRWVDTYGRRQLLLIGAVGMVLGHVVSAITFTAGCDTNAKGGAECDQAPGIIMIVGSSFFIFNFAISWGPVCWIYPAEIFPLNVRAKAVSLSTMANWIAGTMMTFVVKLFPYLKINGVFFLFTALCATCGVFVYFFCPETKGVLLEDIEALFNKDYKRESVASPKYQESKTPSVAA